MNIQQAMTDYIVLDRNKKKELCSTILSKSLIHGGLFTDLWKLIQDNSIADADLNIIYKSAMEILSDKESQEIETAVNNLHAIKNRIITMKEVEKNETKANQIDIQNILNLY